MAAIVAKHAEVAFEVMRYVPARVLDRLDHHRAVAVAVGDTRGEDSAKRGVQLEREDLLVRQRSILDPLPDLVGELGRHDPLLSEGPEPLE